MLWLLQQMHFYALFAFVNTMVRFRVGFSIGGKLFYFSKAIEH